MYRGPGTISTLAASPLLTVVTLLFPWLPTTPRVGPWRLHSAISLELSLHRLYALNDTFLSSEAPHLNTAHNILLINTSTIRDCFCRNALISTRKSISNLSRRSDIDVSIAPSMFMAVNNPGVGFGASSLNLDLIETTYLQASSAEICPA